MCTWHVASRSRSLGDRISNEYYIMLCQWFNFVSVQYRPVVEALIESELISYMETILNVRMHTLHSMSDVVYTISCLCESSWVMSIMVRSEGKREEGCGRSRREGRTNEVRGSKRGVDEENDRWESWCEENSAKHISIYNNNGLEKQKICGLHIQRWSNMNSMH